MPDLELEPSRKESLGRAADASRGSVSSPSDVEKGKQDVTEAKNDDDEHASPRSGLSRERLERREMRLENLFKKSDRYKKAEAKMRELEDKYKNRDSSSTDEVLLSLTLKAVASKRLAPPLES